MELVDFLLSTGILLVICLLIDFVMRFLAMIIGGTIPGLLFGVVFSLMWASQIIICATQLGLTENFFLNVLIYTILLTTVSIGTFEYLGKKLLAHFRIASNSNNDAHLSASLILFRYYYIVKRIGWLMGVPLILAFSEEKLFNLIKLPSIQQLIDLVRIVHFFIPTVN